MLANSVHASDGPGLTGAFVKFEIKVNASQLSVLFSRARSQVPFAIAKTLTTLAGDVQKRVVQQLPKSFDRPTDFTLRGVYTIRAEKANPVSTVYFPKSDTAAGKPGFALREYIQPGAQGTSARHQKRSENLLTRAGYLPMGWVTVPGSYGKTLLDGYGNMPGAYYKQIVNGLQVKRVEAKNYKSISAASQRRAQRMGVQTEFFAVAPGANKLGKNGGYLPSGVYRRTGPGGTKLLQYLLFVKKASYRQRLDLKEVALATVQELAQQRWDETIVSLGTTFKPK